MTIYRMHRARRPAGDYRGAMMAGGRWNPIGIPMLYTGRAPFSGLSGSSRAFDKGQLPRDYVWSKAELPRTPAVFRAVRPESVTACRAAGEAWILERSQPAIRVLSVIIPEEFNVLPNPYHDEYESITWGEPRPFHFDPRLFAAEPYTL